MKLFLGFIAYLALFIAVQAGIPAEEVESMSALMRAMPGLTNPIGEIRWKINHPELACCFRGVICSPAGGLDDCTKPLESNQTIISIETQYFTGGFLPEEIGLLKNLEKLWMRHSRLAGTLPVGLSKLSKLTTLSIQDSLVTGSLPDIMSMPNLETLQIEDSQISSILPGGWAWHKKIANILLARNRIYGNIPASWDAMTPLMNLDLNGNQLTGTIPAFYKTSISALQADDNRLTGPLPSTISPRIHKLSLINNMITGTIPSWNFGTEDGVLGVFRLRNNSLEGTIPNIFDQIKTWGTLDLSRNKLTGTIPPSITEGQLRFPQGGGMYLYKNNLSFCPAPRTVFISFLSDEFCDVGDQATKPPCSCVKIWSGGYCGPIDCIKGQ